MTGMRFRTTVGLLLIAGIALMFMLDSYLFPATRPLVSFLLLVLAVLGWGEFARITGIRGGTSKRNRWLNALGIVAVLYFFGIAFCFAASRSLLPGDEASWQLHGLTLLVLFSYLLVVFRGDFEDSFVALMETVVGALLVGFFFSYYLRIYLEEPVLGVLLVVGVKGNDTAAYYAGKAWGRHRIFKVSPKKTLEGSLAALFFSAIYFSLIVELGGFYGPDSLFRWWGGILLGMMISVVSQLGDLSESLLKRRYRVKDSGAFLPEFGGVLDMIDSLIFSGVLFWGIGIR